MARTTVERFRKNVRQLLSERKMSIQQLAADVGTSRPSMSRILSGDEAVSLERADRIAAALRVPLAELLNDEKNLQKVG